MKLIIDSEMSLSLRGPKIPISFLRDFRSFLCLLFQRILTGSRNSILSERRTEPEKEYCTPRRHFLEFYLGRLLSQTNNKNLKDPGLSSAGVIMDLQ